MVVRTMSKFEFRAGQQLCPFCGNSPATQACPNCGGPVCPDCLYVCEICYNQFCYKCYTRGRFGGSIKGCPYCNRTDAPVRKLRQ